MADPGVAHVEITAERPWPPAVKIGGHMLACSRAVLTLDAGTGLITLTADLPVYEGLVVFLDAKAHLGAETRAALVTMGWTPPAEGKQ